MGKVLAVAALLVLGCAPVVDPSKEVVPPEGAIAAQAAVMAMFGINHADVHWYGNKLDCIEPGNPAKTYCDGPDGNAGVCYLSDNGFGCTAGESFDDLVLVSTMSGVPIHETGLAHELAHVKWDDPDHKGHAFAAGGELEQATDMLASHGM